MNAGRKAGLQEEEGTVLGKDGGRGECKEGEKGRVREEGKGPQRQNEIKMKRTK